MPFAVVQAAVLYDPELKFNNVPATLAGVRGLGFCPSHTGRGKGAGGFCPLRNPQWQATSNYCINI